MSDITAMSLAGLRAALGRGDVKAEEAVSACLARMDATEPHLGAMLTRCDEEALNTARAMDKAGPDPSRPLWGVPVTVKDAICVQGLPATAGSALLENFRPPYDAHVVARLRQAGAVIVGKNNMDEFAMGSTTEHSAFHPSRNPWNTGRVPGGSSGGSAVSVASRQCFASLGTDTGGSIRQPAALCGCVGLKPTYGRVSRYGVIAYGSSLDQVGPLARSAEDAAMVFAAIAGHDERDGTSARLPVPACLPLREDMRGLRLGLPREFLSEGLDPAMAMAMEKTRQAAAELGAEVVEVSLPHNEYSIATYYIIATAEAGSNLARYDGVRYGRRAAQVKDLEDLYTRSRTEGFGQEVQRRILLGAYVLSAGYYDAYFRKAAQVRRLIRADFDAALEKCDAILAPVSPMPAWPFGAVSDPLRMYLMDVYTLSLNLAGLPGLSFPAGLSGEGLPLGLQLMGRAFAEPQLLGMGHALTRHLGTAGQYAPLN